MRPILLLALVMLAGCPGSPNPVYGEVLYTDAGCKISCDKCTDNTFCVSAPYVPTCLKYCSTDADCQLGQQCALLDLPLLTATGCVVPDRPPVCSQLDCHIQPKCRDAKTLLQPLAYPDQVCGWEVVPCVNGCDATTAQCK